MSLELTSALAGTLITAGSDPEPGGPFQLHLDLTHRHGGIIVLLYKAATFEVIWYAVIDN